MKKIYTLILFLILLFSPIINNAKEVTQDKIYLVVNNFLNNESNQKALALYKPVNYKISKRETTPYKNGDKKIRVTRYLDLEKEINEDKTTPI